MDGPLDGRTLAILVGGGPAPGINGVIAAATIEAAKRGWRVLGLLEGFRWLGTGEERVRPLDMEDVVGVHMRGGSILKTSRENPFVGRDADEARFSRAVDALRRLGVDMLVTIGGEGTMAASARLARESGLQVVHVPKTIDNDLPLPAHLDTFGFETARAFGAEIVHNLMEDARATDRWYVVVTMGREVGHLALGVGKAAGAAVTIIPEEFAGRDEIRFAEICDIVEGAVVKRRARGSNHGVAVLAEGLAARLDVARAVAREEYRSVNLAEANLAQLVRNELRRRFRERGLAATVMAKEVGYELRCADPLPADAAYTQDLGYAAVRFLAEGGTGAVVTVDGGNLVPIPFSDVLDPATGRSRLRFVDMESAAYRVAWEYMERIKEQDFADPERVRRLAEAANMPPEAFEARFRPVVSRGRPPRVAAGRG